MTERQTDGRRIVGIVLRVLQCAMLVAFGLGLSFLCVRRYVSYNDAMLDLGNMAQAIASVQRGEPLVSTYQMGRMSRLALHVEAVYLLIAPVYALWSDPRLLLVLQAVLFTLGALPVHALALRHNLGRLAAFLMVVVYLFFPVAMTSVLFDVHGDTLAIAPLMFAIDALDRRAWRRYAVFVALALSCKVYVALPVALLGVLAWWYYRERRAAIWTTVVAVVYGAVAFFVIRPAFVTADTPASQSGLNYILFYFGNYEVVLAGWRDRLFHLRVVLGPTLILSVLGFGWFVAAMPVVLATAISTGPGPAYAYWFHHYALAVPFVVMATLVGAERVRGSLRAPRRWRAYVSTALLVVVAVSTFTTNRRRVDTPLQWPIAQPSRWRLSDLSYRADERDALKDRIIAESIPAEAPIAASPYIAPHLTNRHTLYLTTKLGATYLYTITEMLQRVDIVLADALFDVRLATRAFAEREAIGALMADPAWGLQRADDGLLVFVRDLPADQRLRHTLAVGPDTSGSRALSDSARFGNTLDLVNAGLMERPNGRVRASFRWRLQGNAPPVGNWVAISRIEGIENYRIVHLPTYIQHPLGQWRAGEAVAETFDVVLPPDLAPGTYDWSVGWYNLDGFDGALTDTSGQMPSAPPRVVGQIVVR